MYFSLNRKDILVLAVTWINLEARLRKIKPITDAHTLCDSSDTKYKIHDEISGDRIIRDWEEGGMGSYYLMNLQFQWKDEKVLEMNDGDGCTTV